MSMKGGASGPRKLIIETEDFFDPPGEPGGEFSPCRYLSHLLHSQDPVIIEKVIKEFESLLGSLPEAEIRNLFKKMTEEMQHPEQGMITLLGAYPNEGESQDLDREATEAEIEFMTCLTVQDECAPLIEGGDRAALETAFKALLDHAVPAFYHFKKADEIYTAPQPGGAEKASLLPAFISDINPDFARQVQEEQGLIPSSREIDVTKIINAALAESDQDEARFGHIGLLIPPLPGALSEAGKQQKMRRAFDEMLDAFRDGAAGSFYELRDFIAEVDDPAIRRALEISLQKTAQQRLEAHKKAQIHLTPDEEYQLEECVKAKPDDPGPDPAFAQWLEDLQKDIERNAPRMMEVLNLIEEGPSAPHKDMAKEIARDMARAYADIQIALQDYQIDQSPAAFDALTQALDRLPVVETPRAVEIVKLYDQEAAYEEAQQRAALAAQQQQITFQMEQQMAPQAPSASGPALFGGGDSGGGFA